jgi:hypothetical protein
MFDPRLLLAPYSPSPVVDPYYGVIVCDVFRIVRFPYSQLQWPLSLPLESLHTRPVAEK